MRNSRWFWPVASVLPALVAMRGMFSTTEIFAYRDLASMFWPGHLWVQGCLRAGEFPLWDPFPACGQSAVADATRLLFFPPALLLRLLPFDALSFNLMVGLPLPVAALGMYVFLRTWVSKPAAALGGIVFSTSSAVLSTANMPNLAWTIALAPWVIWMTAEFVQRGSGWRFSAVAGLVGLQVLAAEPVTLASSLAVAGLHATFIHLQWNRTHLARVAGALVAMIAGIALAAIQYLPLLEAVRFSRRADQGIASATFWSLHPVRLLEVIIAFPFGDAVHLSSEFSPWFGPLCAGKSPLLISHYVGLSFIAVATLGLVHGELKRRMFWAAALLLLTIAALGEFTSVYPALLRLAPPLQTFRFPEKYALLAVLAGSALVAMGWDALLAQRVGRRGLAMAIGAMAISFLVLAGAWVLSHDIAMLVGVTEEGATQLAIFLQRTIGRQIAFGIGIAAALSVALFSSKRKQMALNVLFGLIVFDLLVAGSWLNPQVGLEVLREQKWVTKTVATGARSYVGYRLVELFHNYHSAPKVTDPDAFNASIVAPVDSGVHVADAMFAWRMMLFPSASRLRDALTSDVPALYPAEYDLFLSRFHEADREERALALKRMCVRTQVRIQEPLGQYGAPEPIDDVAPIMAFYSDEPFSRVFLATSWQLESSRSDAVEMLFRKDVDFEKEVVIDRDTAPAGISGTPIEGTTWIESDLTNSVTIRATAAEESIVVLLDSFNPGWRVDVDGVPAEVVRVNGLFRGVRVPPGDHSIRFRFLPESFVAGAWISGTTLGLIAIIAAVSILRGRHGFGSRAGSDRRVPRNPGLPLSPDDEPSAA